MKTGFITPEHYQRIQKYEESTFFDYNELKNKYKDPAVDYPSEGVTAATDVIIAGGGPAGLMYGLYLVQNGYDIIIIEPQEIGYTNREWNISLKEMMQLQCILTEEEILSCLCGRIVNEGSIKFLDIFTYKSRDVLDRFVHPEHFLKLLEEKIITRLGREKEEIIYQTHYENFKIKDDKTCVITGDGRIIEGKLFLHGMGSQDEISYYLNNNMKRTFYNVAGINAVIGKTVRPNGDVLRTLENASYGPEKQQIVWELFMSEEPKSDCATIYVFTMATSRGSLVKLMEYFDKNLYDYIETDVISINKVLFGYIDLPDNVTGLVRSFWPRVYSIGEGNVNSVVTGCGFAMCIKSLDHIGYKLVKLLGKDNGSSKAINAKRLNKILPDARQLCSVSIEQLLKETLMRGDNETPEKPNLHCAAMFNLFNLISDVDGRNDMLKSVMRPHLILEALVKVRNETEYKISDFFEILKSNNGDLRQRLMLITSNYWKLIVCEIKEILKHLSLLFLFRKGQVRKSYQHIKNISMANPIRFYQVHRFLNKKALQNSEETNSEASITPQ